MRNKEVIADIRKLTRQEQREMPYEDFVKMLENLSPEEIMEVSKVYGYPVFIRKCMGTLQHKIPILQDGAAAIIENDKGEILIKEKYYYKAEKIMINGDYPEAVKKQEKGFKK